MAVGELSINLGHVGVLGVVYHIRPVLLWQIFFSVGFFLEMVKLTGLKCQALTLESLWT